MNNKLYNKIVFTFLLGAYSLCAFSASSDSISRWGVLFSTMPSRVVALDKYEKKWVTKNENMSFAVELLRTALPKDSSVIDEDFNYPTMAFGLRYMHNTAVRMHRSPDPAWGLAEEVNYDSRLGNILSLYSTFYRAIHRSKKWETTYSLSAGVGFTNKKYDKETNIDNEQIGTHVLIYFGAGFYQTYRLNSQWGLRAGVEFVHHSNGALYRPNKGSNTIGPSLALVYSPYYGSLVQPMQNMSRPPFSKYLYLNFSLGVGAKTMLEDWLLTQFRTPSTSPDYRTETFKIYAAYSAQADVMYRYAPRWASGLGVDWFYGTYGRHIERLDEQQGYVMKHSPWSLGIAAKHQVFYGNFSLSMALGWYLHRQMGHNAQFNESPFYERIGVHYTFPKMQGLTIGINVKAHETKADLTEFVIAYPIKLRKK